MRRGLAATLAAATALTLSACTGVPGREKEAKQIDATVRSQPGVSDVSMVYTNDIGSGSRFELKIDMHDATEPQIEQVAARIEELMGNRFDDYELRFTFNVATLGTVNRSIRPDPGGVARDAGFVRKVADQTHAQVEWHSGPVGATTSVKVLYVEQPAAAVESVLQVAGQNPVTINASPAEDSSAPYWDVREPITLDLKHRVDGQLAQLPGDISYVTVSGAGIAHLSMGLPDTATAYQDLVRTIQITGAGSEHPMSILWRWDGDTATGGEPEWSGTVDVGGCDYPGGTGNLLPDAAALQQRIRQEFDGCS